MILCVENVESRWNKNRSRYSPRSARFPPRGARFSPRGARFSSKGARSSPRGEKLLQIRLFKKPLYCCLCRRQPVAIGSQHAQWLAVNEIGNNTKLETNEIRLYRRILSIQTNLAHRRISSVPANLACTGEFLRHPKTGIDFYANGCFNDFWTVSYFC